MSTHAELTFGRPSPSDIARASTKIGFFNNLMIGKLLGHTQVQTTARYAHLANESVKASGSRVRDSIGAHIAANK